VFAKLEEHAHYSQLAGGISMHQVQLRGIGLPIELMRAAGRAVSALNASGAVSGASAGSTSDRFIIGRFLDT
jgi:hypothetical protein